MRWIFIIGVLFCASWAGAADYYTSPSVAIAAGSGTYTDPWHPNDAADNSAAGDLVYMISGTYSLTETWALDTASGTSLAPITFRGVDATDTSTLALAIIDGSGAGGGTDAVTMTKEYIRFESLRFTGGLDDNIHMSSAVNWVLWQSCRIDNAGDDGVWSESSGENNLYVMVDCEIDSNGGDGISHLTTLRGGYQSFRCSFHDNIGAGARSGSRFGKAIFSHCLFYDNGGGGIIFNSGGWGATVEHSTFFGNTGSGLDITSTYWGLRVSDSIFFANTAYAIDTNTGDVDVFWQIDNLCSLQNTSGHIDVNGGVLPSTGGTGHVLEDPNFMSETDGSEDLTPQNTNLSTERAFPAGGSDYNYIGAIQPECTGVAGGGGGPLVGPGRLAR